MSRPAPVVAEVVRSGFVESRHHGHVVALAADGTVVMDVGDTAAPVLPRSSLKPLQAFAFLRSGWQPHDDEQIALATASHSGEARHVAVVRRILAGAGLDESHLQNTPDLPLHVPSAHALLRAGCKSLHERTIRWRHTSPTSRRACRSSSGASDRPPWTTTWTSTTAW